MIVSTGPSLCPGAFALCDGFESNSIDETRWNLGVNHSTGVTMTIDPTVHMRGMSSLKAHVDAPTGMQIGLSLSEIDTSNLNPIYARLFVLLPSVKGQSLTWLMSGGQAVTGARVAVSETIDNYSLNSDPKIASTVTSLFPPVTGRWVCLQWEIVNGTAMNQGGHMSLTVDNLDGTAANVLTSAPFFADPFSFFFEMGFSDNSNGAPFDVWFDEVAVDGSPLGCNQ